MNPQDLETELTKTKALLAQEQGKRLAVERESYEIKRQAKIATEQAEALVAETQASLLTASQQMQIAHAVSCGIWSFANLGRAWMARKVAAARVVHREMRLCLLIQQITDALEKKDVNAAQIAIDESKKVIETIRKDGEMARLSAAEASIAYGLDNFEKIFDDLVRSNND